MNLTPFLALAGIATAFAPQPQQHSLVKVASNWRATLAQRLPLLGHRNWLCVVDSAYPWQTSPGVELVDTREDHVKVLKAVFAALAAAKHVRPGVYLDKELQFVPETDAQGVEALRTAIASALPKQGVQRVPHEQIIAKLDKAGSTFHVLMLKTTCAIPYTSVFFELGCAYWSDEAESRLRKKMGG